VSIITVVHVWCFPVITEGSIHVHNYSPHSSTSTFQRTRANTKFSLIQEFTDTLYVIVFFSAPICGSFKAYFHTKQDYYGKDRPIISLPRIHLLRDAHDWVAPHQIGCYRPIGCLNYRKSDIVKPDWILWTNCRQHVEIKGEWDVRIINKSSFVKVKQIILSANHECPEDYFVWNWNYNA
jgi:hypothetical protein